MNERDQQLKSSVMRRVRFIYYFRFLTNPLIVQGGLLAALVLVFNFMVSMNDIVTNVSSMSGISNYMWYFESAFMHTRFPVQMTIVLAIALGFVSAKTAAKAVSPFSIRSVRRVLRMA